MNLFTPTEGDDLQPTVNLYEPPHIEILEIAVEKGFADSSADFVPDFW